MSLATFAAIASPRLSFFKAVLNWAFSLDAGHAPLLTELTGPYWFESDLLRASPALRHYLIVEGLCPDEPIEYCSPGPVRPHSTLADLLSP